LIASSWQTPVTDRLAEEVISLPMHAYLDESMQDRVIEAVRGALKRLPA
jgi:dTDP-4-amino-4,6-dideoxygalactose transaminase